MPEMKLNGRTVDLPDGSIDYYDLLLIAVNLNGGNDHAQKSTSGGRAWPAAWGIGW